MLSGAFLIDEGRPIQKKNLLKSLVQRVCRTESLCYNLENFDT